MKILNKLFYLFIFINLLPTNYIFSKFHFVGLNRVVLGQAIYSAATLFILVLIGIVNLNKTLRYVKIIRPIVWLILFSFISLITSQNLIQPNIYFRIFYVSLFCVVTLTLPINSKDMYKVLLFAFLMIALAAIIVSKGFTDVQFMKNEYGVMRFRGFGSMLGYGSLFSLAAALTYVLIKENYLSKKTGYLLLVIFTINIIVTVSRLALVSFIATILFYEFFLNNQTKLSKKIVINTILASLFGYYFINSVFFNRIENLTGKNNFSAGRIDSITYLFSKIESLTHFLIGHGPGVSEKLLLLKNMQLPHNDYVVFLYDFGIIGLILWVTYLLKFVKVSKKMLDVDRTNILAKLSLVSLLLLLFRTNFDTALNKYTEYVIYLIFPLLCFKQYSQIKKRNLLK
jgi:hypothetical protein